MTAIKAARRYIEAHPQDADAALLAELVIALESDEEFKLGRLYELDLKTFDMAMQVLRDWRIDRYYASRFKLLNISQQLQSLAPGQEAE